MKSTLVRILSIMTLATSISAFGLSDKATSVNNASCNDANAETTKAVETRDARSADRYPGQSDNGQEKSRKHLIEEQERQWLKDVQYSTAG